MGRTLNHNPPNVNLRVLKACLDGFFKNFSQKEVLMMENGAKGTEKGPVSFEPCGEYFPDQIPKVTPIIYETWLPMEFDLEAQEFRKAKMFEKIQANIKTFKTVENLRDHIFQEMVELELNFKSKVQKWFTLKKQVEFLDKVSRDEIKFTVHGGLEKMEDVDVA